MPIIKAENLRFYYNQKKEVIKGISLSIEKGEYVCIVGHNGSGKSTFAKLLNGILTPTSGSLEVCGYSVLNKNTIFDLRKKVGVVFQNPDNQLVASIVEDDIAFGPENIGIKREEIRERIDFALKAVNMEQYKKATPSRLSGGQKQRIAIAGVLALKPEVLVLDESTAMLDPRGRKEVIDIVRELNNVNGTTVVAITHYLEETVFADKVIVMSEGEINFFGTPREVFAHKKELKEIGLEVPYPTYIADKLKNNGINIENDVLTPDDLVEEICKLK